jgi:6-phosphogluconate dehydrogenase
MENQLFDLGMIGMGVMGRNLLLNMADNGFKVIGFNRSPEKLGKAGSRCLLPAPW